MNIYLIGFMGAGKSSVGKKLARELGYNFVDMDSLIEEKEGMSVLKIFSNMGEEKFRKMERKTLEKLVRKDRLVVSTGGGVPCAPGNMDLINKSGISIYLEIGPEELFERLRTRQDRRPLIKGMSEQELKQFIKSRLSERESHYKKARFTVNGLNRDVDEILGLLEY